MTKFKFLFLVFIVEVGVFATLVVFNLGELQELWFSLALLLIGAYSLIYSYLYKMDSSLYFGCLLIGLGFTTAYRHINEISFAQFYPIYIACFAFAHFAVFVVFRQNIHFKLFAILAIEAILLISYKIKILSLLALVLINVAYLIFVLINGAIRVRKNLRRVK